MQKFRESAKIYYMPVWTLAELTKLHNAVYAKSRSVQDVRELYRQWGGCVRWVLEKPKKESENLLEDSVNASTADNLLAACKGWDDDNVASSFHLNFDINPYIPLHLLFYSLSRGVPSISGICFP